MRLALALAAVLLAVPACSEAQDAVNSASSTANKVADCSALVQQTAQSRITDAQQLDPQEVQRAADGVEQRIRGIDDADVRSAAQRLQSALETAAKAAEQRDTAALAKARQQVTDAVSETASACGIPVDQFTR
jgi:hypothetical protein